MKARTEWRYIFSGWILFASSAVFYSAASILDGNWLSIAGSLLFLIACLVFMVPAWKLRPGKD